MLVPTTVVGWTPRLSRTRRTPMCASPRAPPPDSTSARPVDGGDPIAAGHAAVPAGGATRAGVPDLRSIRASPRSAAPAGGRTDGDWLDTGRESAAAAITTRHVAAAIRGARIRTGTAGG